MKTQLLAAGLLVLGMAIVPGALADHDDETADESDESVGDLYLVVTEDGLQVWEESNDHDGLQTTTSYEDDSGNEEIDPDTQIL